MPGMTHEKTRKTKIICTIGPASEKKEILMQMAESGMNVVRLNFSHGSHPEHLEKIKLITEVNKEMKKNIAILLDTKGPEIRTGDFRGGSAVFEKGQKTVICDMECEGTSERFSTTYSMLYRDVEEGGIILVNDGQLALRVDDVSGKEIHCTCLNGGEVKNRRGINVPGIRLSFDYLSERDKEDLIFGCTQPITYVAASFVRRAQDVIDLKKVLIENGRTDIKIIAKIENAEGVENLDEILDVADGIMVARGDLGVEVPSEDVPLIQKETIIKCRNKGKIVITATQMLESMQQNPRPTRAEVSDVANAIYDGTDAIMLSGETAAGRYPVEAIETMDRIARKTESSLNYESLHRQAVRTASDDTSEAICMSVAEIATKFGVDAIIAFTNTGFTARRMSRYRPEATIIAATPYDSTIKSLTLSWGVKGTKTNQLNSRSGMLEYANLLAKENGIGEGNLIIVTGGDPRVGGITSFLELMRVK